MQKNRPSRKNRQSRQTVFALLVAVGLALAISACARNDATSDTRGLQITLLPAPEGINGTAITVLLADSAGTPITDATVGLEGNMSHAGMVPVMAAGVQDGADGQTDGSYSIPFQFDMLGDWIISVTVERADGATVQKDIDVAVTSEGVSVEGRPVNALSVTNPIAQPAPLVGGNGAVYLTLVNGTGVPDRLVSAASPLAATVEFHETVNDNGILRMQPQPDGFEIPAAGSLVFQPGGKHIMLVQLTQPLAVGDTVELTLNFTQAEAMVISVPVVEIGATEQDGAHDHGG